MDASRPHPDSVPAVYGRLTLFSGLAAWAIVVGWHGYLRYGLPHLLDSPALFAGFLALAVLFQYVIPVLVLAAFLLGVPLRRLWTARFGMAGAALAAVDYALAIREMFSF